MTEARLEVERSSDAPRIIEALVKAVRDEPEAWFFALMSAIRQWSLPEETVNGRSYRYLIAGEAFDWLLLAERLADELVDVVPSGEIEDLLFHGKPPVDIHETDWKNLLGAKYRPHLNFVYGVQVESALQLQAAEEVFKEHQSRVWENGHVEDEAFERTYGRPRRELFAQFAADTHREPTEAVTPGDLNEFTYWLFRYRVNNSDPARVASDTRKGTAALAHLDALRTRDWGRLD